MINPEYQNNTHRDVVRFFQAEPFHHLILDNFIETKILLMTFVKKSDRFQMTNMTSMSTIKFK